MGEIYSGKNYPFFLEGRLYSYRQFFWVNGKVYLLTCLVFKRVPCITNRPTDSTRPPYFIPGIDNPTIYIIDVNASPRKTLPIQATRPD